jgi:hypothetical protein
MQDSAWIFMIPITAIIGGITVVVVGMMMKARVRELEIKERIAMIERGLVPPPEKDPQGFERAMGRAARARDEDDDWDYYSRPRSPRRYRSGGVTLMGVGLGLIVLIGFAGGNPQTGIGVGGFLIILGLAFFVNSRLEHRQESPATGADRAPVPSRPSDSGPLG